MITLWFLSGFSLFITSFKTSSVADPFYVKLIVSYCRTVDNNEKFGMIMSKILTTKCCLLVILLVESISIVKKLLVMFQQGKCLNLCVLVTKSCLRLHGL